MRLGEEGQGVGPNLVCRVAVSCDPVGSGDDELNFSGGHRPGGRAVGDYAERNVVAGEFPSGEAKALQSGARFAKEDFPRFTKLVGFADDSERGSDSGSGEAACVADGQDAGVLGHARCAMGRDGIVGGSFFGLDFAGGF